MSRHRRCRLSARRRGRREAAFRWARSAVTRVRRQRDRAFWCSCLTIMARRVVYGELRQPVAATEIIRSCLTATCLISVMAFASGASSRASAMTGGHEAQLDVLVPRVVLDLDGPAVRRLREPQRRCAVDA